MKMNRGNGAVICFLKLIMVSIFSLWLGDYTINRRNTIGDLSEISQTF